MEITTTPTVTGTNTTTIKTPEAESETPARIQYPKPVSFTNGVLKRHHPLHHHHHQLNNHHPVVVTYGECLKNHAASLGRHAVDGCGEFMPSPNATPADPTSLKCAACGCHRSFHRRELEEPLRPPNSTAVLEYQPHHRHHPPPPAPPLPGGGQSSSPNSPSPPPISSSYYPSAPHILLALSTGLQGHTTPETPSGRKRFRTKFSQDQKERMCEFAERVEWKMQKKDEELIAEFCSEIGVERGVLKVWMHNNKNTLGKRDQASHNNDIGIGIGIDSTNNIDPNTTAHFLHLHNNDTTTTNTDNLSHHRLHNNDGGSVNVVVTNGSSSSS